jgi:hypothetical protein
MKLLSYGRLIPIKIDPHLAAPILRVHKLSAPEVP